MSHMYQEQISRYVDGLCFCDKIDQSIAAKQSEQLVIKCVLCGSVHQKSKIKCCKVSLRASQKFSRSSSKHSEKKRKKK